MATNYPYRDNLTLLPGNSDFLRAFDIQNTPVINAAFGGQYGFAPNNFRLFRNSRTFHSALTV